GLLLAVAGAPDAGTAFDAGESFVKGIRIFSLQMGGGAQADIETLFSGITFLEFTPRVSYLQFEPSGSGLYRTASTQCQRVSRPSPSSSRAAPGSPSSSRAIWPSTRAIASSTFPTATRRRPNFGFEANTGVIGVSFFFH